ncbi:putative transcription factor interactor and regulator CCHC(Zn) family [Arabidopsis thaliana]
METIEYSRSDEEDSYGYSQDSYYNETKFVESWHDDGYSSGSDFEEEPYGGAPEPEPPDRYSSSYTTPSYPKPKIRTWENLKWIMYENYCPQCLNQGRKTTFPPKQAIQGDKMPKTTLNLTEKSWCKGQGHIAKDCPTKKSSPRQEPTLCLHPQVLQKQVDVSTLQHDQVQTEACQIDYNVPMTLLMHLSSAKSIEKVSSTKEIIKDQGKVSTMEKVFTKESQNQGELTLKKVVVNKDESVEDTIPIKEEPPNAQQFLKTQCKLLNPYTLQWTNLTYLCVGKQVLRTKPLEEGGDNVRMGADVPADALVDRLLVRLLDGLSDGLLEVLHVSNQLVRTKESYPFLPFCASQSHIWKPGDPLRHPEPFTLNPWCIFPYVNPLSQDFPFPDLNEIKSQRLYFDHLLGIKKPPTMTLDVPKSHHFQPKLSRLKTHHKFPYLADFVIKVPTAIFSFIVAISLLI